MKFFISTEFVRKCVVYLITFPPFFNCLAANMSQQKRFSLLRRILICLQLFNWISISLIEASKVSLTQNELRDKYGQGILAFTIVQSTNKVSSKFYLYQFIS